MAATHIIRYFRAIIMRIGSSADGSQSDVQNISGKVARIQTAVFFLWELEKGIIEIIVGVSAAHFLRTPQAGSRQSSAPPPPPHPQPCLSSSKPGGPYLCLDHAGSLVSQVLQGSGNINLFSTCNRARIGAGSKQQRNPAHICQSLFTLAPFGAALRLKIITFIPGKTWSRARVR